MKIISGVRPDILPRDIRNEGLVSAVFPIEDQAVLLALSPGTKSLRTEKHSELQGHIKSRKSVIVELSPGKIVNSKLTFLNYSTNFLDPNLATILNLQRATRTKFAGDDDKDQ